jgi:hypothetical protein
MYVHVSGLQECRKRNLAVGFLYVVAQNEVACYGVALYAAVQQGALAVLFVVRGY